MNIQLRRLGDVWMCAWIAFVSFAVSAALLHAPRTAGHVMASNSPARDDDVLYDKS